MLNELIPAGSTKAVQQLADQEWDARLKPMARGDIYKITICDGQCCVDSISRIASEHTAGLRKYEVSNGMSFPGFNLPAYYAISKNEFLANYISERLPKGEMNLSELTDKQRTKYLQKKLKENFNASSLKKALSSVKKNDDSRAYENKVKDKVKKCIKDNAEDLWNLLPASEKVEKECHSFWLLNERLKKISETDFICSVYDYAVSKIDTYDDWEFYSPLIFLTKPLTSTIPGEMVYLDIADYRKQDYSVAHKQTIKWINSSLLAQMKTPDQDQTITERDAYNNPAYKTDQKMPSVNLPALGPVILRSMVKEAPCHFR